MKFTFKLNLLLCCFFIQSNSFAQSIQKKFTQTDGLASYNIRYSTKDVNGFFWVCTQEGLSKFDGKKFINYSINNKNKFHQLDFTDCRNLLIDTIKNHLWVLGTISGINVIDCNSGNIIERHLNDFGSGDTWLISWKKIGNELWIGSNNGLWIFDLKSKQYKKIDLKKYHTDHNMLRINTISYDNSGHVFVFTNEIGLLVFDHETKKIIAEKNKPFFKKGKTNFDFLSSAIFQQKLFVGTTDGLLSFNINRQIILTQLHLPAETHLENTSVKNISIINDELYIASNHLVNIKNDLINFKILSQNLDDSWLSEINSIAPINENLLMLGCNAGIAIFDLAEYAVTSIVNDEKHYSNKLKHLFALFPLDDKSTLAATQNGLFKVYDDKKLKTIEEKTYFQNLSYLGKDDFLVSNKDGLKIFNKNKLINIERVYKEFYPYRNWSINSCITYNDSIAVLGTENFKGILLWNKVRKSILNITTRSIPLQLKSNSINSIFLDSKKRLWVLSDYSVTLIDLEENKNINLNSPNQNNHNPYGLYFDMVEVNNDFWLAAYGIGIIILDGNFKIKKIISQNEGLCNNGVYKIFREKNKIFVSSNNGISLIDATSLKIKNLFAPDDGLHGNSFEEASGAQKNGKIYFGGLDGFTVIEPSKILFNKTPPRLYFQEINIETTENKIDTTNVLLKKLSIPNNYIQTKISFVGLNYQNPTRVNYWYRISELNKNWINLKSQNFIDLIGIMPGKYHLQVKAANEDGVESPPIELALYFLPKWYQTLLFKILTALTIAMILFALYKFRIGQLKKVLQVRQKISQNLHDDIGSTLSAINLYAQVAKLKDSENSDVNNIDKSTKEVLDKLDDIIWATNPQNDKIKNLVERMEGFAKPLLNACNIQFNFTQSDGMEDHKIGEAIRQNLFIIFKETINNLVKHAQCKNCTVSLNQRNKTIFFTITDDGIGFDSAQPTQRNGLINMQLRVQELKGKITIDSQPGKGSTIAMQLPL